MNANTGEAPKFEFPAVPAGHEVGRGNPEESLSSQENAVGKHAPSSSGQLPPTSTAIPSPIPPTALPTNPPTTQTDVKDDNRLTAAEIDRIEKEWVDKAKTIVAKTRDDPHTQNNEMSKVKADYIKKRFNKTIPTDDTVTV